MRTAKRRKRKSAELWHGLTGNQMMGKFEAGLLHVLLCSKEELAVREQEYQAQRALLPKCGPKPLPKTVTILRKRSSGYGSAI